MLRKYGSVLTVAVMVFALVLPVLPAAAEEMAKEGELKRVRKKVEALRAWRLTEELQLDEETSAKLFPAMREADEERRRLETRNRELVREMAQELKGEPAQEGRIDEILDELTANRREMNRAEERHLKRVRKILDSEGTAKYLMFQLRFERDMKRKAAEAFQERRRGGESTESRRGSDDSGSGGSSDSGSGAGDGSGSGSGSGKGRQ